MSEYAIEMRNQLVGLFGIVERNMYLTKRYFLWDIAFMFWTIANTLTIVFIARAAALTGHLSSDQENTLAITLLVGATIWAFLGIIFEFMTETVAWERWEGTIEYTFMAPLSRLVAPVRAGRVRGAVRPDPGDDPLLRGRAVPRPPRAERELRRGVRVARARVHLVHRRRDHDLGAAADLAGEGRAARLRRAGPDARRLGRLLPGQRDAGVDAVDREDLAGDVRAARLPRVDRGRRRARSGRTSGRC